MFCILQHEAGREGVGSILHYLAPASLSWGGGTACIARRKFQMDEDEPEVPASALSAKADICIFSEGYI